MMFIDPEGIQHLFRIQAVPLDNLPNIGGKLFIDFGKLLDPKVFLVPLQELAQQLIWVTRGMAFLFLVWTFKQRLQTRAPGELWATMARSVVLVAVIAGGTQLVYMVDRGINGILAMPIHATTRDGVQLSDTLGTTPDMIGQRWALIMGEVKNPAAQAGQDSSQNNSWVPGVNQIVGAWNFAKNLAWNIIHGIWRLAQLLTMFFLSGVYILQRILLIAGGVYFPIAIGQLGTRTLRSSGLHFIQSYLGLFAWPLGWGVVNLFVLAAIAMNPARVNVTVEDLIRSLVLGFPILVGIVLGYFLAPFMIQKVVVRGGSAIQAFLGQMFAASVGAGVLAAGAGAALIGKGGGAAMALAGRALGQPGADRDGNAGPLEPSSAGSGSALSLGTSATGTGSGGLGSSLAANDRGSRTGPNESGHGGSLLGAMRNGATGGTIGLAAKMMAGAEMAAANAAALGDAVGEAAGEGASPSATRMRGYTHQMVGLSHLSGLANKAAGRSSSSERARQYLRRTE
jgi:hypothetical protein